MVGGEKLEIFVNISGILVVYTANWVIIYHFISPIKGTRNSYWFLRIRKHFFWELMGFITQRLVCLFLHVSSEDMACLNRDTGYMEITTSYLFLFVRKSPGSGSITIVGPPRKNRMRFPHGSNDMFNIALEKS